MSRLRRKSLGKLNENEGGRREMCQIMENRINEEKIELAKRAIASGKYSLEAIAGIAALPLAFIQELARAKTA